MTQRLAQRVDAAVDAVDVAAYTIPTDAPESDGTLEWRSTTLVVVHIDAGGESGIGWTYGAGAGARLVDSQLAPIVTGRSAFDVGGANLAMRVALRNVGVPGLGSTCISAVDVALWDVKAKLLGVSLVSLLGAVRDTVPIYGSGGFCSYDDRRLAEQLAGWVEDGIPRVKMKIGREPSRDPDRVQVARDAIGADADLYVDANGAYPRKQALRLAHELAPLDVSWFEEPVSSNDVEGLRLLRDRLPVGMEVAAGEYAYTPTDFRALVGAVDCMQADVTRCGGITGLLAAAAVAEAHELELSGHTAPTIHAHVLCAVPKLRHLEWFHDHVRIERMLFDGFLEPEEGHLRPDPDRPGLGIELKRVDAERYAV